MESIQHIVPFLANVEVKCVYQDDVNRSLHNSIDFSHLDLGRGWVVVVLFEVFVVDDGLPIETISAVIHVFDVLELLFYFVTGERFK